MMAVPATVVYFVGYENLRKHPYWKQSSSALTSEPLMKEQYVAPLVSGAMARSKS